MKRHKRTIVDHLFSTIEHIDIAVFYGDMTDEENDILRSLKDNIENAVNKLEGYNLPEVKHD